MKYDGAVYLCGYAIELALKAIILKDKLWGFPEESDEFKLYEMVKTHDLENLLKISGKESLLNDRNFVISWALVKTWRSEFRYRPIGMVTESSSMQMLSATREIFTSLGIA